MPLSTEVQVAVIFGVLGVLLAVASAVLAYMAVREVRRKRHNRDDLELQTSYGSERAPSIYPSLDHRHYPLFSHDSGYRDYLLSPEMRFPKPNTGFERLHDVDRPSSFQFDFRHTLR